MNRTAQARWTGALKSGQGTVTSQSAVLDQSPYSFPTRFEDKAGTNPEDLIGAAHASCYAMALSMILGQSDLTPDHIDVKATVTLEQTDGGFAITRIHLDVDAVVPGASNEVFQDAAQTAKIGCPISKALKPAITLDAVLSQ